MDLFEVTGVDVLRIEQEGESAKIEVEIEVMDHVTIDSETGREQVRPAV